MSRPIVKEIRHGKKVYYGGASHTIEDIQEAKLETAKQIFEEIEKRKLICGCENPNCIYWENFNKIKAKFLQDVTK